MDIVEDLVKVAVQVAVVLRAANVTADEE